MLKKIIIMVMGMICGVGLLLGWQEYQKSQEKETPVQQPEAKEELIKVDFDLAYEAARREKHFLDQREESLRESTEKEIEKLESEGNDAANTFDKYRETE